jgi:hypothetical protein
MAISDALEAHEQYAATSVDLLCLKYKIDQAKANLKEGERLGQEMAFFEALVQRGMQQNYEMLDSKSGGKGYWAMGAVDVALAVTFLKAGQWVGQGAKWVAVKTGSIKYVTKFTGTISEFGASIMARIGASGPVVKWEGLYLVQNVLRMGLDQIKIHSLKSLRFLKARGILSERLIGIMKNVGQVYKRGLFDNWKYVAQTQFLQVLAEAYSRREMIYDPNPFVMAKNLFTNKDFLQNLAYMSHETVLMAGIASGPGSLKRKYLITGAVSFVDSAAMNVFIRGGNVDPNRMYLDTGWEVVVGNLQTQVDFMALKYFDQLAVTKKNPKLRLLGYAVAMVDQFVGFTAYSKATDAVNEKSSVSKPSLALVPVMAPVD